MTKCICGTDISPDNVHYHQGCGTKIFQDSDMTIPSINQMVAENKQRAIPFSYTGEVVDFLLASIEGLSEERDSFQRVGIKAMERAEIAEADAKVYDNNFCVMEELFIESQADNTALTKKVEGLREDLKLTEHKLITCGVAATHSNKDLSYRKADYGGKWDSPQAQSVRTLRARYEQALAATEKEK